MFKTMHKMYIKPKKHIYYIKTSSSGEYNSKYENTTKYLTPFIWLPLCTSLSCWVCFLWAKFLNQTGN